MKLPGVQCAAQSAFYWDCDRAFNIHLLSDPHTHTQITMNRAEAVSPSMSLSSELSDSPLLSVTHTSIRLKPNSKVCHGTLLVFLRHPSSRNTVEPAPMTSCGPYLSSSSFLTELGFSFPPPLLLPLLLPRHSASPPRSLPHFQRPH